jgi:uncharacterized protein
MGPGECTAPPNGGFRPVRHSAATGLPTGPSTLHPGVPVPHHIRPRHFYQVFADLARGGSEAARILHAIFSEPHPFTALLDEMTEVERVAAAACRELVAGIDGVTVTPLDREDVHQVASELGGLVSLLHDTARSVHDLRLTHTRESARTLSALLVRATGCIEESVAQLRHPAALVEKRVEMERLCEEGTAIYDRASANLFCDEPDAIEVLRWKGVFDALEHALTRSRRVQNLLSSISLENR